MYIYNTPGPGPIDTGVVNSILLEHELKVYNVPSAFVAYKNLKIYLFIIDKATMETVPNLNIIIIAPVSDASEMFAQP